MSIIETDDGGTVHTHHLGGPGEYSGPTKHWHIALVSDEGEQRLPDQFDTQAEAEFAGDKIRHGEEINFSFECDGSDCPED